MKMNLKTDVSFSGVCPVIDHEFHHNIVKVGVDPRGDSRHLHDNPSHSSGGVHISFYIVSETTGFRQLNNAPKKASRETVA